MSKVTIHGKKEPKQPTLGELEAKVGQYAVTGEGTTDARVWRKALLAGKCWWICTNDQHSTTANDTGWPNNRPARLLEPGESFTVEVE